MDETPARPASPIGLTYVVAASQILGLAVITVMAAWIGQYRGGVAWDSSQLLFNVHPLCMVIGMVFLQGDALLVYRVFRNESKQSTKILHGLIHFFALIIALVGLLIIAFGAVVGYILTREEWRRPPLAEELALSMDFKNLTEEGSPTSTH
ncbi:Cytochrome protein [Ophiophagus hannah]|uniref:Transmembrane ascorbate-dependent reductase CYB561 n=1 Tax=Ophiophagus hannah TaxID=8665 RepID=V8NJV5_OPHHA|nr:Cytochrome protein [Ophiophagus hannah]